MYWLTSADVLRLLSHLVHAHNTCCWCTQKTENKQFTVYGRPVPEKLAVVCSVMTNGWKCRNYYKPWIKELDKNDCVICRKSYMTFCLKTKLLVKAETSFMSSVIWHRDCLGTKLTSRLLTFIVLLLTLSQTRFYWLLEIPMATSVYDSCTPLHYEKTCSVRIKCFIWSWHCWWGLYDSDY